MTTKQDRKTHRIEAKITRKQLADAAGISQFRLDKLERNDAGVADEDVKAYDEALKKLLARAGTKPAKKAAPAKKTTTARTPRTRRSTTQPKAGADEAKAEAAA
jgi:DNA-binding XRE family transcriptional regulator